MSTTTAVKERPILFSGPMVRAILAGTKTQTRRIIKPQPERKPVPCFYCKTGWALEGTPNEHGNKGCSCRTIKSRGYWPGEQLWVREAWRPSVAHGCVLDTCDCGDVNVHYPADGHDEFFNEYEQRIPDAWLLPKAADKGNVPSIHMPRWASRINLEITEVRAERLQDIPAKDILAEGAVLRSHNCEHLGKCPVSAFDDVCYPDLRSLWAAGWEQINGTGSWNANPWVWVVEFKRVEKSA